jgi:hypothetical protein
MIDSCRHVLSESKKAGGPKEFEARAKHHKAVENRFGKDYATLEDAPEGLSGINVMILLCLSVNDHHVSKNTGQVPA